MKKILLTLGLVSGMSVIGLALTPETVVAEGYTGDETLTVYKSPYCGCCSGWVDHMKEHGFKIHVIDKQDMAFVKDEFGVDSAYQSCHTSVLGDMVIEGHVPASDIIELASLGDKIDADGIAVAGMPVGSPGMENNGMTMQYNSVLFKDSVVKEVFKTHN